jgi:alkaline phosphatase
MSHDAMPYRRPLSPRVWLTVLLGLALAGTACAGENRGGKSRPDVGSPARHVILLIGDGMELADEIAASRYLAGKDLALSFHHLPYAGNMTTWDVTTYDYWAAREGRPPYGESRIDPLLGYDPGRGGALPYPLQETAVDQNYLLAVATDSASSATAWATGWKTERGNIAWASDAGRRGPLETLAETLRRQRGFAVGIVSTVPFSHATPAAHVSHSPSRDSYHAIADEILGHGRPGFRPEVVIGGGHPRWYDGGDDQYIAWGTYAWLRSPEFRQAYVSVERTAGRNADQDLLEAARRAVRENKSLFGLFGGRLGHFEPPLPVNRPGLPELAPASAESPSLAAAAVAALTVLDTDPDGFFLMLEQGDIDWANHRNDFRWMVGATLDLHRAVQAVIDWVERPGDDVDWENTLLVITADHSNGYLRLEKRLGKGELPAQQTGGRCSYLPWTACDRYPGREISYATDNHTNEPVRWYAKGRGASLFAAYQGAWYPCTDLIDNTQLYHVMADATRVRVHPPLEATLQQSPGCGSGKAPDGPSRGASATRPSQTQYTATSRVTVSR